MATRHHEASPNQTSEGTERFVRRNINILQDKLPEPDVGPWTVTEIGMHPWEIDSWLDANVIEHVGTHPEPGRDARQFKTTRDGWLALQHADHGRLGPQLPCGHYGIHNPRDRKGIECAYEDCDALHEKADVQGVSGQ